MQEVPSILGGKDALRKRLTQENALREAAVAARAKVFWQNKWAQQALPVTVDSVKAVGKSPLAPAAAPVPSGAVYKATALDEGWDTPSLCGIRRDRLVFYTHAVRPDPGTVQCAPRNADACPHPFLPRPQPWRTSPTCSPQSS